MSIFVFLWKVDFRKKSNGQIQVFCTDHTKSTKKHKWKKCNSAKVEPPEKEKLDLFLGMLQEEAQEKKKEYKVQ